ncbi:MAG: hypothetical protein H7Y43_14620 [Akkermansiaceae bacterium]|nr:hypothetical protein [Verrucomicrobiales bacterium]
MTKSHYDMNLVGVDAFFRHLRWTGDLDFARRMWPTIERHLAWERRLFRREFGPDKLPLYEAYCCIWASDDLAYNGGGGTHSSAYNLYHNQLAARLAQLLGKDSSLYEREAELIAKGMRQQLWLPDRGWFGEWKDLLGGQFVHPNAAAWTFYHTVDSEVPTPVEAWQMSRFVDTQIARIPVRGANVPEGNFTMPTSSWMPYTWSLNNVVLAETMHSALAYWQAGRREAAMPLFKGALLDSMFLGLCPGNVGMTTFYDCNRRESQRDFGDGVGSLSRALVEGLFGVQPDALSGELKLRPGFPASWNQASIKHPDFEFTFQRTDTRETYSIQSRFRQPLRLRLQVPALRTEIGSVTVNGLPVPWQVLEDSVGTPRIEINAAAAASNQIVIEWKGDAPALVKVAPIAAQGSRVVADCGARILNSRDPQGALSEAGVDGTSIRGLAAGTPGHRTVFAQVEQGSLRWWQPVAFEIRAAWELIPSVKQDSAQLRFRVRNNTAGSFDGKAQMTAGGQRVEIELNAPAFSDSAEVAVTATGLRPGSNPVIVDLGRGSVVSNQIVNWQIQSAPGARFDAVDLTGNFNDRVTQIFRNEYLEPRSPFCSLALPKQGFGSWCHPTDTFEVDDSGLRAAAAANESRLTVQGVPFHTPTGANPKNILFTSQWQNYPAHASVPLNGRASHAYLLMAGSSNPMQSRFDNGEVTVTYTDGTTARLALHNPINWWPIDQDYFIDDFAFRRPEAIPPRVDLKTGKVRVLEVAEFKGKGRSVPGGAATVLDLPLDATRELKSLTVRAIANEVVIGLMSVTLAR